MTRARRGSPSQTSSPGTALGIDWNSPRTSTGAFGFGSNVSIWLGAPYKYSRMHDLARPNDDARGIAWAAGVAPEPSPRSPAALTRRRSRRVRPSQRRFGP